MVLRLFGHYIVFINRREEKDMAVIYVALIIKGKKVYSDVPEIIKPKVKELLIDLELEDLITK